ncbi:MAG: DNA polymerase III subunit beta [Candidatus Pacebacteria bacterium]|jgi:DNA polymerase-3 subunit beta|nr:DNA polymerase III subunit beta [Candidatus Paceibacterota bacterium]
MKIIALQENLKQELDHLQKVVPNKPQLPILSSIFLKTQNNKLLLAATDLYLGIRSSLVVEVKEKGSLVVDGDTFRSLISSLSPGKIDLELSESVLKISQGKTKVKLSCQSAEEYPKFPKVTGNSFNLKVLDLEKIQNLVVFASSNDQTRPVLTSLLMKFSNKNLMVIGTDGFRLASVIFNELKFSFNQDMLVPAKAITELLRIAKQCQAEEIEVTVANELKQLLFRVDSVEFFVRLIEGDYPPYQKIVPPNFKLTVEIDSDEFLSQLKRAQIFARETSNIVRLSFKNQDKSNFLVIKAISPSYGEYLSEVLVNIKTELSKEEIAEIQIAFNALYLIEFINAVNAEKILMSINENLKPAQFASEENKNYFYISMPFRVNE